MHSSTKVLFTIQKLFFLFLHQDICRGCSNENPQHALVEKIEKTLCGSGAILLGDNVVTKNGYAFMGVIFDMEIVASVLIG